jgi:L-amino acid N-acyltransferase YncA
MIRDVALSDAAAICGIYNHYISNTVITFEEVPLSPDQMAARISDVTQSHPWIVYLEGDTLIGYAYAGRWKARSAYKNTVEVSIYLHHLHAGKGIGSRLMAELLSRLRAGGFHAAVGGAALPNDPSVRLQEKFGFKKVAHFPEVGYKFGKWIDVGYWELVLQEH